jgi:hypothetical protein
MLSAGDLGHDAAIFTMEFVLTRENIGFAYATVDNDRRSRVVTGGFDAEEPHDVLFRDRRNPPLSGRSVDGIRAAWIAVVLLVVSLPHVLEDFAVGEPQRVGVSEVVAISVLLAAYAMQLLGAWLALNGGPWGGRLIAAVGAIWVIGAVVIHGPGILAQGVQWRSGSTSIGEVVLVLVASALAMWYGAIASQSGSRAK